MKASRFLRVLPLVLLLAGPAQADQASIVGPTVGPKNMTEVMTAVNAALLAIQSCNSGTSAPANGPGAAPKAFQCWADTSASPVITYKTYDGTSWVAFGQLNTSTHVWTPYRNGALVAAVATSSSAADLTTGILPAARLPAPTASALGGVQSKTCSASQWLNEVSTAGVPNCVQPNFTDIAGTAALAQLPPFSGMPTAAAAADPDTFPTNQGAGNLKQTLAAIKTWIKAWVVKADVGLGNVDNTSDATKWGAAKTLTNTTFDTAGAGNSLSINGVVANANSGAGAVARATSPVFAGVPAAPTAANGTNTTQLATTEFVQSATTAPMAPYTFKGNSGASPASPGDFSIGSLSQKASPAGTDEVMIADNSASGAMKRTPVSALGGGGVSSNLLISPQHRITLSTGVAVMQSSVAGATTVYVTPTGGNLIPVYNGVIFTPTEFAETSQLTTDATKSPAAVGASQVFDIFCWVDPSGSVNRCTRGPAWTNSTTRGYTLTYVNGIPLNTSAITNGPAALRGTWMGTIASNASSTIDWIRGGAGSGGVAGRLMVYNAWNQANVMASSIDTGAFYTYASATIRQARASAGNQITYLVGATTDAVNVSTSSCLNTIGTNSAGAFGIGLNITTAYSISPYTAFVPSGAGGWCGTAGGFVDSPLGVNTVSRNESVAIGSADYNARPYSVNQQLDSISLMMRN